MTTNQARAEAQRLFGTKTFGPGERSAWVRLRRKHVEERFEVGYWRRPQGVHVESLWLELGRGATWEQALERAAVAFASLKEGQL